MLIRALEAPCFALTSSSVYSEHYMVTVCLCCFLDLRKQNTLALLKIKGDGENNLQELVL